MIERECCSDNINRVLKIYQVGLLKKYQTENICLRAQ